MEITRFFNFGTDMNHVDRNLVQFVQLTDESNNLKIVDAYTRELLFSGSVKTYLDGMYDATSYDDWSVQKVFFDDSTITLYVADERT